MHLLLAEELPYDPNQVTPGVIGFAVTALVALAVILLLWDFNRRVRRINDRATAKERLLEEIAASQRATAAGAGTTTDDAHGPAGDAGAGAAPDARADAGASTDPGAPADPGGETGPRS